MHRIAGDDMTCHIEFFQKLLHGWDFVGLFVNLDMRQHQRRVDGECAEHLFRLGVVEAIKTAFERLAVERDNSRAEIPSINVQIGRMLAEGLFNIRRGQPLQNIADGRMRGRLFPIDFEGLV